MTVLWGSLESACVVAFGKLSGYEQTLDIRAVIITAHLNFQQRIDAIATLCEHLAPDYPTLSDYEVVIKQLKAAQKARNKFAHNPISVDESGQVGIAYATARGTLKLNMETIHLADIKEACSKIHKALCSLHSLITGHKVMPIWDRA
ncbi:hypothetical protein [Pseudomonas sp. Hp2]|uniref:hypothetical protein n=1 Tax=Pseudomonas sp. Hp2 TaxID=701189 RepID=UPI001C4985E5|nr:hypothetical protein [Pseudomonas sp. Hp2]